MIDPQLLFALWLYATLDGVGSGRKLAQLCESQIAYQWLCGGVSVGYHTLSDFRVNHGAFLDQLLSKVVTKLLDQGLVSLDRVAHDGIRVRASAGTSSFHRRETLDAHQRAARELIETLKGEIDEQTGPDRSQKEYVVDGGYARHADIEEAAHRQVGIFSPVMDKGAKGKGRSRYEPWARGSEAIKEWRERMGSEQGQAIHREHGASIEPVNAQLRQRGLWQLGVRGREKLKAVVLWHALAHHLVAMVRLMGWGAALERFLALMLALIAAIEGQGAAIWRRWRQRSGSRRCAGGLGWPIAGGRRLTEQRAQGQFLLRL